MQYKKSIILQNIQRYAITPHELPREITHCIFFSVYFSRKGPWQPPAFRAFSRAAAPSYQHQQIKLKS